MELIVWFVIGAITVWLAGQMLKGRGFGLLGDIFMGVVGGLIGGWLAGLVFTAPNAVDGINLTNILIAFLSGAVLIVAVRGLRRAVGVRFNTSQWRRLRF